VDTGHRHHHQDAVRQAERSRCKLQPAQARPSQSRLAYLLRESLADGARCRCQPRQRARGGHARPGLSDILNNLSKEQLPALVRGDCGFGTSHSLPNWRSAASLICSSCARPAASRRCDAPVCPQGLDHSRPLRSRLERRGRYPAASRMGYVAAVVILRRGPSPMWRLPARPPKVRWSCCFPIRMWSCGNTPCW